LRFCNRWYDADADRRGNRLATINRNEALNLGRLSRTLRQPRLIVAQSTMTARAAMLWLSAFGECKKCECSWSLERLANANHYTLLKPTNSGQRLS